MPNREWNQKQKHEKQPDDKMIYRKEVVSNLPNDLHGRDAILRVRDKLLISNIILQLWADVKYHVPTGFFVVKRRAVFILLASPKGCFLCFLFRCPQYLSAELCQPFLYNRPKEPSLWCVGGVGEIKKASFERRLLVTPEGLEPSTH